MTIEKDTIFGEWLLNEMEARGISVVKLAELSGVTAAGLRSILYTDRNPKMDTMQKITAALGKKIMIVDRDEEEQTGAWHTDKTNLPKDGSLIDFVLAEEAWPGGRMVMTCGIIKNGRIIIADGHSMDVTDDVLKWHKVPSVVIKESGMHWDTEEG